MIRIENPYLFFKSSIVKKIVIQYLQRLLILVLVLKKTNGYRVQFEIRKILVNI